MREDESLIVRVIRWVTDDGEQEERRLEHRFEVDVSEALRPILERLDLLMEASQNLDAVVQAVIGAVREAEARIQAKVSDLEAQLQADAATIANQQGSDAAQTAAIDKLNALKDEISGIVPAATAAGATDGGDQPAAPPDVAPPAPADGGGVAPGADPNAPTGDAPAPPDATAPPAGDPAAPPADAPPADAPPADAGAPPADAPPADVPPADAPPADAGTPPTP